jgi:DNA-directed RNA polymerase subunit E'/Rpb7
MTSKIFHESILNGKVKLKPSQINKNFIKYISEALDKNYQGKFTKYGLIRHGSIKLLELDMGQIEQNSLEGYVNYNILFQAEVCLPANGMILLCDVISINNFGVMCTITDHENKKSKSTDPIIKIIVPKKSPAIESKINLEEVISGNKVYVQIMGVKPQLNDSLICCIGLIIRKSGKNKNEEEDDDDNDTKKIYTQVDPNIIVEGLQFNDDELPINEPDLESDGDGDDINGDNEDDDDEDDDDSADKKSSRIVSKKSKQNGSGNNKKYVYNVITDEYEPIDNHNEGNEEGEGEDSDEEIPEEYPDDDDDDDDDESNDDKLTDV